MENYLTAISTFKKGSLALSVLGDRSETKGALCRRYSKRMSYTPTSLQEFPRQSYAARTDLSPGIYDGENSVLYFAKMPGMIWCSTSRVQEVVVADGVISCSMLQPSHGDPRLCADTRNFEGPFSYMCDSVNRNYNITIHPNVARLTLKATATPRPLTSVDARMMAALKERLDADDKCWHK